MYATMYDRSMDIISLLGMRPHAEGISTITTGFTLENLVAY